LSLPIDVARRRAQRSLVASESTWLRTEAELSTSHAVLESVLAYYDAALLQERVELLKNEVANLEEATRVLTSREAAGTASGYESTRLLVATELSRSHLADARGSFESARARLIALLGLRPGKGVTVQPLALQSQPPEQSSDRASPPALEQARAAQRHAREARGHAEWAWFPTVEFGAGLKRVDAGTTGYGYVVGLSVDLPVFDRAQALEAEANAQATLAAARARALDRTLGAELAGARLALRTARAELERFERETEDKLEVLLLAAQSGYREGQRSIVELLDAQRARTEVAEQRLVLLGRAKRAEATLRAATGALK
jgi:cobalt-zinc-cadmium efflux system outer membrane protein